MIFRWWFGLFGFSGLSLVVFPLLSMTMAVWSEEKEDKNLRSEWKKKRWPPLLSFFLHCFLVLLLLSAFLLILHLFSHLVWVPIGLANETLWLFCILVNDPSTTLMHLSLTLSIATWCSHPNNLMALAAILQILIALFQINLQFLKCTRTQRESSLAVCSGNKGGKDRLDWRAKIKEKKNRGSDPYNSVNQRSLVRVVSNDSALFLGMGCWIGGERRRGRRWRRFNRLSSEFFKLPPAYQWPYWRYQLRRPWRRDYHPWRWDRWSS